MKRPRKQEAASAANVFQFSLAGLIIFSLALVGVSSFVGYKLTANNRPKLEETFAKNPKDKSQSVHTGAWGTLITRDIDLERPVEYLTEEVADPKPEAWTFNGLKPEAVKALLTQNGLSAAQVAAAFAPGTFTETGNGTVLQPSDKFLLALDGPVRAKLYIALAGLGVNLYLDYPYIFPGDIIGSILNDSRLNPDDVALFKQLTYLNGNVHQLSDYPFLLTKIPTVERRVALARSMSRQSAVLAGLMIKPDTDIDKIASYWGNLPNVRFTDIRPMMEALKELPEGGNLSLFYLLPKFARDRLYTFPLPPQAGEPTMDCHWSTFNFGNDTPDNRFNDPAFAVDYIRKNYYPIAAPSICGDILLLMNDKQEVKHSAVFLADDIVFTKNGNNYRQPWMLMRISDLLATYPATPPMKAIYMRRKTD
ncbi:MAG TPA: hypothetical protein VK815_02720 [Candidatus Acidoferrales bacterium]|nr:hypothetical protein [Candidatus Acidoferrales bacterium]